MTVSVGGGVTGQGNISRLLQNGINAIFQQEYNDYVTEYSAILDVQKSDIFKSGREMTTQHFGIAILPCKWMINGGPHQSAASQVDKQP